MAKRYRILKGTVNQLKIIDDPKELRSDNISLIAIIGVLIVGVFGLVGVLLNVFTAGNITLKGKGFCCYVGRKFVEGKLTHIGFKNGDYVEMVVDKIDDNFYQSYAVRIPKTHALYFPRSVGMTTLLLLKYLAIGVGAFFLFIFIILSFLLYIYLDEEIFLSSYISVIISGIIMFFIIFMIFFILLGGSHTFVSNRIFSTLGYPKPLLHDCSKEHFRFKKLNRSNNPELYDDPQTPEFERIKIYDRNATYYCRTPIIPDWVEVIDERGFTSDIDYQESHSDLIS